MNNITLRPGLDDPVSPWLIAHGFPVTRENWFRLNYLPALRLTPGRPNTRPSGRSPRNDGGDPLYLFAITDRYGHGRSFKAPCIAPDAREALRAFREEKVGYLLC